MVFTLGHRGKPWNASLEPIWFIMMTFTKKIQNKLTNEKYSNPETDRQVNSESF